MHFTIYPANHPAGPAGWPMNIHNKPVEGSIEMTDEEYEKYRAERQPMYDAWLAERERPVLTFLEKLQALTEGGYTDEILAIKIKATDTEMKDRWVPLMTSALNMKDLGVPTAAPILEITDYDGVKRMMSIADYQMLMLRYGTWFAAKFAEAGA
jgi:hypothetical protein